MGLGPRAGLVKEAPRQDLPKRMTMAGNGEVQNDYPAHQKGYGLFLGLMKWGTILSLVAAAIVVLIIAN